MCVYLQYEYFLENSNIVPFLIRVDRYRLLVQGLPTDFLLRPRDSWSRVGLPLQSPRGNTVPSPSITRLTAT